jgi:hypothetical protein
VDCQSLVHAFGPSLQNTQKTKQYQDNNRAKQYQGIEKTKRQERGQGGSSPRGDTGGLPTVWRHRLVCTEPLTDPTTTLRVDLPLRVDWERIETPKKISPNVGEFISDHSE